MIEAIKNLPLLLMIIIGAYFGTRNMWIEFIILIVGYILGFLRLILSDRKNEKEIK